MEYEEIEEFIFKDTLFFKESLLFLRTLENSKYYSMVYLIDEGFSFEYVHNKLKLNEHDIKNLIFILKSYWGLKRDNKLLNQRDFCSLAHMDISLPLDFYKAYYGR